MCLNISSNNKKLIADRDIICYKFLVKINDSNNPYDFHTPFTNTYLQYGLQPQVEITYNRYKNEVLCGYHSFANLKDVTAWIHGGWYGKYIIIRKCIIPKGSEYHVGKFNGVKGYASNNLIITKNTFPNIWDLKNWFVSLFKR